MFLAGVALVPFSGVTSDCNASGLQDAFGFELPVMLLGNYGDVSLRIQVQADSNAIDVKSYRWFLLPPFSWYKYTSSNDSCSWDTECAFGSCSSPTELACLSLLHMRAKWFKRPHLRHLLPVAGQAFFLRCASLPHLVQAGLAWACEQPASWLEPLFLIL